MLGNTYTLGQVVNEILSTEGGIHKNIVKVVGHKNG